MADRLTRIALLCSFALLGTGIVSAYLTPATGYELSIYTGTPLVFWIACCLCLLVSMLVVFSATALRNRLLGASLGSVTMMTIVSLPLVRGYHFLDESDALSHLGVAKRMYSGQMAVTESRYPIVHTLSILLHDATGFTIRHAMLLLIVVFILCFFLFVPLAVRLFTGHKWAPYIGFYSALLLLPINHLAPSHRIHPTSQALLYAPAFLFVFFTLYRRRTVRRSILFLLLAPMFVMLHPQQAANLVACFGAMAATQVGLDTVTGHARKRYTQWVIPEVVAYLVIFWIWVRTLPVFQQNTEQVGETLGGQIQFAQSTASRSGSLETVGGSLPEVFMKLFFVSLSYTILTALMLFVAVRSIGYVKGRVVGSPVASDGGTSQTLFLPVYVGLVPVALLFGIYLIGGISDQYFRHLGMLMVFATILGSVGLVLLFQFLNNRQSRPTARRTVAIGLILFVALSVPVVFTSPYIYDASDHVTESQIDGYETTFEYRAASTPFDDVRSPVSRYAQVFEKGNFSEKGMYYQDCPDGVPDHFNNRSLRMYYDQPVYVPVTQADRVRDPILWKGFRFSKADFEYLDTETGISKVQSNGGYTLYLVNPIESQQPTQGSKECVVN